MKIKVKIKEEIQGEKELIELVKLAMQSKASKEDFKTFFDLKNAK